MKFTREPAVYVGFIGAVLTALVGLNLPGLNAGQSTAIVAVLTAIVLAVTTRPIGPAVFTGLITAGVALFTEYGVNVPESWVTAITSITLALFAFLARAQVTPAADPRPDAVV